LVIYEFFNKRQVIVLYCRCVDTASERHTTNDGVDAGGL